MADSNEKNLTQANLSLYKALEKVFQGVSSRTQEILKMRYGIGDGNAKTLEEIGKKYQITRERVRQIIKEAFKKIRKSKEYSSSNTIIDEIVFTLKKKSGIIKEEELFILLGKNNRHEEGSLRFFLELLDNVVLQKNDGLFEKSWMVSDFTTDECKRIEKSVREMLAQELKPLTSDELHQKASQVHRDLNRKKLFDFLAVFQGIKQNSFGKWGLSSWKEINPKGTREKIYLVLFETGKPLHFREITDLIDKKIQNKKKTHPQTVHNELIKDSRFVLVGRGIYALSEWGYTKGTVKEVLEGILKKSGKPMKKNEILDKVLDIRKVKKTTVVINLNNFFTKVGKDTYTIIGK